MMPDNPRSDALPALDLGSAQPDVTISLGQLSMAVVGTLAVLLTAIFVQRLHQVAELTLSAVVIAVSTLPIQRRIARWIGNVGSLVVTALLTVTVSMSAIYIALRDLSDRTTAVADLVELRLSEIRQGSLLDQMVSSTRIDRGIAQWIESLPSRIIIGGNGGSAMATQIFLFLTVVVLATFLQASGASVIDWLVARWPRDGVDDDDQPRFHMRLLIDDIDRHAFGFFRRILLTASGAAVVVGLVGWLVNLPGALALGIWVGVWAVVPSFGPPVAMAGVALFVVLDQRPLALAVVVAATVCTVAATMIRRRAINPVLHMRVAPYLIAVSTGTAIGGLAGSAIALVVAASFLVVIRTEHHIGWPAPWTQPANGVWSIGGLTLPKGWRLVLLSAAAAASGVALWAVLSELAQAAVWLLVGAFVAIALSRPVRWVSDRLRLDRSLACLLVCTVIAGLVGAAALTGADDGANATTTLTDRLPAMVADLEEAPIVGPWLQRHEASVWVERQMEDLPQRVRTGRPADWLPFVGDRLLDLFWIVLISIALLLDGPRLLTATTRRIPARHRRQWQRLTGAAGVALGGYAAGAAIVAGINATVIFAIAVALGLGVAPALAMWGFIWNFVPQIGGFMGGLPLIVFALVLGPWQGLFAGFAFVAYQFVENHIIQPSIIGEAIGIAPWGTLLAALAGAAMAGLLGAIVLTPLVGVIRVIRQELAREDFPGVTANNLPDA